MGVPHVTQGFGTVMGMLRQRTLAFLMITLMATGVVFAGLSLFSPGKALAGPSPQGYVWPLKVAGGTPSTYYSSSHGGIDIASGASYLGAEVIACMDGRVDLVQTGQARNSNMSKADRETSKSYGNFVRIYHPKTNTYTYYCHLQSVKVKQGNVSQGQVIGTVGNTGYTTGNTGIHLHFEMRVGGTAQKNRVNPYTLVSSKYIFDGHTHNYNTVTGYKYKSYNTHTVTKKCSCGATQTVDERCSFTNKSDEQLHCTKCNAIGQPYGSNKVTTEDLNGMFIIKAKANPKYVVDVYSGLAKPGTNVWLYENNKTQAQVFQLVKHASGAYNIISWMDGYGHLLSGKDWSGADSVNVELGDYNLGQWNKQWFIEKLSDGSYAFRNRWSNNYLDAKGGGDPYNGQNIQQYMGNGSSAQKFVLTRLSMADVDITGIVDKEYTGSAIAQKYEVTYGNRRFVEGADYTVSYSNNVNAGTATITFTGTKGHLAGSKSISFKITKAQSSGKPAVSVPKGDYVILSAVGGQTHVLDVDAGRSEDGRNVQIWKNHINRSHPDGEIFHISGNAAGHGITLKANGKGIHTQGNNTGHQNVHQWTGSNANNGSSWVFEDAGDGWCYIRNKFGYYLDVENGKDENGANVRTYTFNGATSQKWKLLPAGSIADASVKLSPDSYTYDGKAKKPAVTVKNGPTTLVEGADYTVSYANNVNVGTARVTVTGMGGYRATEKTVTFKINPVTKISLDDVSIAYTSRVEYTGSKIGSNPTVWHKSQKLQPQKDYTLSISNNLKVGTATVTLVGQGSYTGTRTFNFSIVPASISGAMVASIADQTATGSAIKPKPKVTWNGKTLVEGEDYTLSYKNNVNVGTATVTITGKENFTGTKPATFKINSAVVSSVALDKSSLSLEVGKSTTLKAAVAPPSAADKKVTWKSSDTKVATVDSNGNIKAVGKGSATITATAGGKSTTCWVSVVDSNSADISDSDNVMPSPTPVPTPEPAPEPEPAPVPDPEPEPNGEDSNQVWKRLAGGTAYGTMQAIVDEGWSWAGMVIVATFDGYWDALSASALAGVYNAPILLTDKNSLTQTTANEIVRLNASNAIIVGGKSAVSEGVKNQIQALGVRAYRIAGNDAQQTAVQIAKQVGGAGTCIIATSGGFWDALSASPYAYAKKAPIYLTAPDGRLRADTLKAIKGAGHRRAIIVGGPAAIPERTASDLLAAGLQVQRSWGDTAIQTSLEFADLAIREGMKADHMGVATSEGYWDALTGGALCGRHNGVLVLANNGNTAGKRIPSAYRSAVSRAYVFGGTEALNGKVFSAFESTTRSTPRLKS